MSENSNFIAQYIENYYDRGAEREWERLARHRTEFVITLRVFEAHLPSPPARILDCGGGPGRYAIELARRGYQVTLFDLSAENLNLARAKADEAGVVLEDIRQGTALDLSAFADEYFDAVLLLGPLYHLMEAQERAEVITQARRVLRSGGPLFAAFISRYAGHRYAIANDPDWVVQQPAVEETLLQSGKLPPRQDGQFSAYMAHPTEIPHLFWMAGLEVVGTYGVEGLASMIDERLNAISGQTWDRWCEINFQVAQDAAIHAAVEHLLVVSVKPRWRKALGEIVVRLDKAGISYKVVGGAALALYGVRQLVKDLDFEMTVEDVYRFQELFAAETIQPVSWQEGDYYRSHFGRFNIQGLPMDVMGDLQRREADGWKPTMTSTEASLDLDGVQVRVPWLEEETLANMRRGRLERAALCLPVCDPGKMRSLLSGEQKTDVI